MRVGSVLLIAEEDGDGAIPPYPFIRDIALVADAAGLDSIWVFDHLLFRFDGTTTGIHEGWTILSALAEATERVELGAPSCAPGFAMPHSSRRWPQPSITSAAAG